MEGSMFASWPVWLLTAVGLAGVVYWYLAKRKQERQKQKDALEVLKEVEGSEKWRGKRICVLVNPFGGGGKGLHVFNDVVKPMFEQAGIIIDKKETQYQGHAKKLMGELDISQYDAVVTVSGDGMLSEILNGLYQRKDISRSDLPPLGVIPAGTGNGLATTFGAHSPIEAAKIFLKGKFSTIVSTQTNKVQKGDPKPLDLMTLSFVNDKKKGEHFSFMVVHFGMTGDADRLTETTFRWMPLRMTFVPLYIIMRKKGYRAKLTFIPEEEGTKHNHVTQGKVGQRVTIDDSYGTVCACIVPWLAHDLKFAPKSTMNNGYIDLIIIRSNVPRLKMIKTFIDAEAGTHISSPWVEYYRTKGFTLEPIGDAGTLMMDGEVIDFTQPIEVSVIPKAGLFVY